MTELVTLQGVSKHFRSSQARPSLVKWLTTPRSEFQQIPVLKDLFLRVSAGECVGIVGKNGGGKSTLLKIIAGISQPSSGTLKVAGEVLPIFSWEACIIEDLEVRDNLCLFGALCGLSSSRIAGFLPQLAKAEGIEGRLNDQMRTFSPGMRARLALRLADYSEAPIVLLDEVLSAGDAEFRRICSLKMKEWKERGRAVIHVSHDMNLIESLSDRCLHLTEGALVELTAPE